jgi:hypothetical protein
MAGKSRHYPYEIRLAASLWQRRPSLAGSAVLQTPLSRPRKPHAFGKLDDAWVVLLVMESDL